MLSPNSLADKTSVSIADEMSVSIADEMSVRTRFCLGAWLACGGTPVLRHVDRAPELPVLSASQGIAMPLARPWARKSAFGLGYDAQAAGQAKLARQQRTSNVSYAHLTYAAIKDGGNSGPHPARDPV
jgi:hypothetical protein